MNDPKAPSDWFKVDGVDALVELALNLHWSWNHAADELWEALDKELWATTQNPWVILRTVSHEKIKAALGDAGVPPAVSTVCFSRIGNPIGQTHGSNTNIPTPHCPRSHTSAWSSC